MTCRKFLMFTASMLACTGLLVAQEFRAKLTGRVTDSSDASIPGCSVRVINIETDEALPVVTDARGDYTVTLLRPGKYRVTAEATGFKRFTRDGLVLAVGQSATLDIRLAVGDVSETVVVKDEAPLLDAAKADRGQVISNQGVSELPLNGRNPFMLSATVAGVNFNGNLIYERPFDNGSGADWSINGGFNRQNEFLLDGAPNNSLTNGNNLALIPPVDAVQEFKIQTNSYDAQYGRTSGGIVNVSLKSGTNMLHGTLFEFMRRSFLDANSFQNNAAGAPRVGHYQDQFGGEIDGPVYLPKIYNGKDKTFFMFTFEQFRDGTPRPFTLSVPQPEFFQGDFSKLADKNGNRIAIYDPLTGQANASGAWVRQAFPGNMIPVSRVNPIAKAILSYGLKPNTVTPGQGYSIQNCFLPGSGSNAANGDLDRFHNVAMKFDQNFGSANRVFFRAAWNNRFEFGSQNGLTGVGSRGQLPQQRQNRAYGLDWVGTASPSLIFNARLSFNRFFESNRTDENKGFDMTSLGYPLSMVKQLAQQDYYGAYQFGTYNRMGGYPSTSYTNTWALAPNATFIHGAHMLKGGLDVRWVQYLSVSPGNGLALNFDQAFTQAIYNTADSSSGNAIASTLLGYPSGGSADNNVLPTYMYKYYAPYLQDDWKISKKLTLNLGLRWDFNTPANERYNRMNRGFDATVVNPVDKLIDHSLYPGTLKGSTLFAGVNGQPREAANLYKTAVQPRIGFAYHVEQNTVVRGGWGRYYMNPNGYMQTIGFSQATPFESSLDSGRTPALGANGAAPLFNPFPSGMRIPAGASGGALTFLGQGFTFFDPEFKPPHMDQFSLGIQRQLPLNSMIEVSYVGSRGNELQDSIGYNQQSLASRKLCNPLEGGSPSYCDALVKNPFVGLAPFSGTTLYSAQTVSRTRLQTPYPEFGAITRDGLNTGKSWYNAAQVVYQIRAKGGLTLHANYTLSKMIQQSGWTDSAAMVPDRGISNLDRTHNITVSSVWELPFGKGKKLLNTSHTVLSRLVSGWQNAVMFTYASGIPWAYPSNVIYVKNANMPNLNWDAPVIQGVRPCVGQIAADGSVSMLKTSTQWGCAAGDYNFLILPNYAPGMLPSNDGQLRNPSAPQISMSMNKTTVIKERLRLQFRAEAFNLTNTYDYYGATWNNSPNSSAFGSITKATVAATGSGFPRQVQFALKLLF
jgi:hypothetical protein